MKLQKTTEILKIEEALKKAKLKQKEKLKKTNLEFSQIILNKIKEDENFKKDLKSLLEKYNLNKAILLLNNSYGAFITENNII